MLKLRATDKEISIFFFLSKYFHAKYYLTTTNWFWWHIQVMEVLLYSLLVWFQVLKQYMWWAVSGQPFTSLKNIAPAFCSDALHSCIQISGPSLPPDHGLGRRLGTVYSSLLISFIWFWKEEEEMLSTRDICGFCTRNFIWKLKMSVFPCGYLRQIALNFGCLQISLTVFALCCISSQSPVRISI